MKEYLRAATRIAREMKKSCHNTCTLAHVRRPVNPMEKMFSGSGSKRSRHLSRPSLFTSPPTLLVSFPISFGALSCPLLPPAAETTVNLLFTASFLGGGARWSGTNRVFGTGRDVEIGMNCGMETAAIDAISTFESGHTDSKADGRTQVKRLNEGKATGKCLSSLLRFPRPSTHARWGKKEGINIRALHRLSMREFQLIT